MVSSCDNTRGASMARALHELVHAFSVVLPFGAPDLSAHGLAYDGRTLLVRELVTNSIYEISPMTGETLRVLPDMGTEGIALLDGNLWTVRQPFTNRGTTTDLGEYDHDGQELGILQVATATAQDLVSDGQYLYYVTNGPGDPLVRVDPLSGEERIIVEDTQVTALYAATYDGEALVVVNDHNDLVRFDRESGALIDRIDLDVEGGWISAIAAAWSELTSSP